jgi:hypothetical protein|nr:hypothetical protein [Alteromonas macleodii]|tara:strand:- start:227 stop:547 length:321 start_codon:yes stop_codon:yes gene_type:complete
MKAALILLFRNFGAALLTRHMVLFLLKLAAKFTENKIDDNVVGLINAGFKSDIESMQWYIEAISNEVEIELRKRREAEEAERAKAETELTPTPDPSPEPPEPTKQK